MGLSSSKSTTKTNQTQTGSEQTSGTQVPITPDYLLGAAQDYVGRIADFGQMDPNSFVAGASPLQQQAWGNVGALSGWQGQARTAAEMAQQAGTAQPNYAGNTGFGSAPAGTGGQMQAPRGGGPAFTYGAPQLGGPSLVSGQGYSAPQLGSAQGYAAARAGQPIGVTGQGYNPSQVGNVGIAPTANATASDTRAGSLLDNFASYQNPYTRDVIDASLNDFDANAGRQRAGLAAAGARNGAFGGSRFGIAEGTLLGEQGRGRASLDAGLRDQGFQNAAALSGQDAAARQSADTFNAQNRTGVSLANAGAENQRALALAGFTQQGNLANMDAANQAGAFGAAAGNAANMFTADYGNRFGLDLAGRQDTASQFGLGQQQQRDIAQAGLNENAGQFGAQNALQAALANQNMQGQYDFTGANLAADAGRFNAGANNDMSRFNAGQGDAAQARALMAAQQLQSGASQYAGDTRADLGAMAALGDQQRQIEQQYALSPLAQLQSMGQLSGLTPYDILVGRSVNGTANSTGTMNGTQTTTQSPSMFSQLLGLGSLGLDAFTGGAFGGGK